MAQSQIAAFPPEIEALGYEHFYAKIAAWFPNLTEEHQAMLDEISQLPFAHLLQYGVIKDTPAILARQTPRIETESCLLIYLRGATPPVGASWEATFASYRPGTKLVMYYADIFRKCATNEPAALLAFLQRLPLF